MKLIYVASFALLVVTMPGCRTNRQEENAETISMIFGETFGEPGCRTSQQKENAEAIAQALFEPFAPLYRLSMFQGDGWDVLYCTESFRHKQGRWPKDYSELSAFVKQSDGYLIIGEYDKVDLRALPDDGLEIGYLRPGRTNLTKLTLTSPGDGSRSRANSIAHDIGVAQLRTLLQTLAASHGGMQEIPQAAWPESVRRFKPVSVQFHMTGMLIVLSRANREQQGLLVMFDQNDNPGAGGSGAAYDSLGEGLFWCSKKIREAYIPPNQRTNH